MSESKTIECYSREATFVSWNMEDFPMPCNVDPHWIADNIKEALYKMGFNGEVEIAAYGDHKQDEKLERKMVHARIVPSSIHDRGDTSPAYRIPLEMILNSSSSNFWVIAKQRPGQGELHRVQECLKARNQTVLVVDDTAQEIDFDSEESLVECTRLLGGGKPIRKRFRNFDICKKLEMEEEDLSKKLDLEEEEDIYKIVNFSEPMIPHLKEVNRFIFWDVVDCPFPKCQNPDDIYHKIDKALCDRGVVGGDLSIWAYVDDENNGSWSSDEYLRQKTWKTRIYFLPGGASRRNRMLNDMLLVAIDTRDALFSRPAPLTRTMVFSDQFKEGTYFFQMLRNMHHRILNNICLVTPTQHLNKPEGPEWPALLLDEGPLFFHFMD